MNTQGFTLIEIILSLALFAILSVVTVNRVSENLSEGRFADTVNRMLEIRNAMVGDPNLKSGTGSIRRQFGYLGDVGAIPTTAQGVAALITNPGVPVAGYAVDTTVRFGIGWNGSYLNSADSGVDYTKDAWGTTFVYNSTATPPTLTSYGADRAAGGTGLNRDITLQIPDNLRIATVHGFVLSGGTQWSGDAQIELNAPNGSGVLSQTLNTILPVANGYFSFASVPLGVRSATIYIPTKAAPTTTVGPVIFTVDQGNFLIPAAYTDIGAAFPTQVAFKVNPATSGVAFCSSIFTLESRDAASTPANVTVDEVVSLTHNGTANLKFYSDPTCSGVPITSVTITSGTSTKDFYMRVDAPESVNVTNTPTTLTGATVAAAFTGNEAGAADRWTATPAGGPNTRYAHSCVYTGTKMVVWGGNRSSGMVNSGDRYDVAGNSWAATTGTSAPTARELHSAVWTGTEMIVWGGRDGATYYSTGSRYNPTTDAWSAITNTGAPTARIYHSAIWTGTEMIIWGGQDSAGARLNTGARYNPTTDTWTAITTTSAPSARNYHRAIWDQNRMIVWGGSTAAGTYTNTGAIYSPTSATWTGATSVGAGVPTGRYLFTMIQTLTQMIPWGGTGSTGRVNTGSRYTLASDTWSATGTGAGVPTARDQHSAAWDGQQMIIWGGQDGTGKVSTGSRYSPSGNTWTAITNTSAPAARTEHCTVWTGTYMIVWGGLNSAGNRIATGARYNPY